MRIQSFLSKRKLIISIVMNLFITLLLMPNIALSQNENKGISKKINDTCVLESFSGKRVQGMNYLNCTIRSKICGYYLVLEKSTDGKTFLPFSMKKGGVSPNNLVLQFSFTDSTSSAVNAVYKICAYKFSIIQNGGNKYLWISENLLSEFDNSIVNINSLEDKPQLASWK